MHRRVISLEHWIRRRAQARSARRDADVDPSSDRIAALARALAAELVRLQVVENWRPEQGATIVMGPLCVDVDAHELSVYNAKVVLKPREFALVRVLVQNAGRVLSRDQLLELAWPDTTRVGSNRTVDVHIRRVRAKLGAAAKMVCTVGGIGYKIVSDPDVNEALH